MDILLRVEQFSLIPILIQWFIISLNISIKPSRSLFGWMDCLIDFMALNRYNYMSKYLYYILPMIDYTPYAQRATKGITLNKESIGDIEIPIPPSIRKKIVDEAESNKKKKHDLIKQVTKIDNSQAKFIRQCTM